MIIALEEEEAAEVAMGLRDTVEALMNHVFPAMTGGNMGHSNPPPSYVSQFVQVSNGVHKLAKYWIELSKLVLFNTEKYQNYRKALHFPIQCIL